VVKHLTTMICSAALRLEVRNCTTSGSGRLALAERTLLVSAEELPHYIPYTVDQIRRLRADGKLPWMPDLLGKKRKILYNLRDVEATVLTGKPSPGPLVRNTNRDRIQL
jgi:hypothetical protein